MQIRQKKKAELTVERSAVPIGPLLQTVLLSLVKHSCPACPALVGLDETAFLDEL